MEEALQKIRESIERITTAPEQESVGRVVSVKDGVAEVEGLTDAFFSEKVLFETNEDTPIEEVITNESRVFGLVLGLNEDSVSVVVLGESAAVREGTLVKRTESVVSVGVSDDILGRVVNPLGEAADGGPAITAEKEMPLERECYGVIDRQSVSQPLHTGIKIIDAVIPIGRGQRELIIGDRSTGKTAIAIDTIINQKHEKPENRPVCIYVAVGQKNSKTARIVRRLEEAGVMEYTIVVNAPGSSPAALQYLAPFTGAAIGEYFMEQGKDALVIYDDLSKHAAAYRQISLLLRRPPGREAYPGDIFYLHSRLLERAVKLNDALGGGSLTALPVIETQEGDVSAYISTNVISITDGQIFLDTELFNRGIRPAVDAGISVSRVGSSAQTKAIKESAGALAKELAQYRELESFVQFAQDLDDDTKQRIDAGRRIVAFLKQDESAPLPFEREAILLYAAGNGLFEDASVENIAEIAGGFTAFIDTNHTIIPASIRDTREIADETKKGIDAATAAFRSAHANLYETRKQ